VPISPTPHPSRSPSSNHGDWPFHHLDTILERSDRASLRSSASAPKLRNSPQRSPQVVKVKESIHSIHPQTFHAMPWPLKRPLPTTQISTRRSFSAPDLDYFEDRPRCQCSSSSSSGALQHIPVNPAGPAQPRVEPPRRAPTPPGLPSFGTKEAQELRLHPEPAIKRKARELVHWLRGEREESTEVASDAIPGSPTSVASSGGQAGNVPMDMLQRLFGSPRIAGTSEQSVTSDPRASVSRSACVVGLPRGVSIATSPGALATAPDGTFVRGKFGTRMSAHGVGARALSAHPLARGSSEQKPEPERNVADVPRRQVPAGAMPSFRPTQYQSPTAMTSVLSRESSVHSPGARSQDIRSIISPLSLGSPRMQEPPIYSPPSPHDRTGDSSHRRTSTAAEPDQQSGGGSQTHEQWVQHRRELSEKDRDGCCGDCWNIYCLECCEYDNTVSTDENRRIKRRVPGYAGGSGGTMSAMLGANVAIMSSSAGAATAGGCHSASSWCAAGCWAWE
jgi:hypothetical protein